MYQIKADLHVHSITSIHAYSTIEECAHHAAERNLGCIAITDHMAEEGFATPYRTIEAIRNTGILPREIGGVAVLNGVEIDIADLNGRLAFQGKREPLFGEVDICDMILETREFVIAAIHALSKQKGSVQEHTKMYLNVMKDPRVNALGHIGRVRMPFEVDTVLLTAKETKTLIEINNHSFRMRGGEDAVCRDIAVRCAELEVPVIVSSDAHSAFQIGEFGFALTMLAEIGFPENLIVNRDKTALNHYRNLQEKQRGTDK